MVHSIGKILWKGLRQNSVPVLLSLSVHVAVAALVLVKWQPTKPAEQPMLPQYVKASLVALKTKTAEKKPVKKTAVKKMPNKVKPKPQPTKPKPESKPKPVKKEPKAQAPSKKIVTEKKPATVKPKTKPKRKPKETIVNLEEDFLGALEEENAFQQAKDDAELAASYHDKIREAIEYQWNRPPSARRDMEVQLAISLVPTGDVVAVSVTHGSGNEAFDRSALQAVEKVGQFPELINVPPRVFEKYFRQFKLLFRPEDLRK